MTVEWSRSNSRAIWTSESGVSSRARNIARWRARAIGRRALGREEIGARDAERRTRPRPGSRDAGRDDGRTGSGRRCRRLRSGSAWSTAPPASGSSKTEETARTRVSAPSSRRTLPGARFAISRRTSGSGSWSTASEAKRQRKRDARAEVGRRRARPRGPTRSGREGAPRGATREPGGRSLEITICLPAANRALKVWTNSSSVLLLALEELDVVDEKRVEAAVALLEALGAVGAKGGDELAGESLRGRVVDGQSSGWLCAHVAGDRAHEVRLAEPGRAVVG